MLSPSRAGRIRPRRLSPENPAVKSTKNRNVKINELQQAVTAGFSGRVSGVRSLRLHSESAESDPFNSILAKALCSIVFTPSEIKTVPNMHLSNVHHYRKHIIIHQCQFIKCLLFSHKFLLLFIFYTEMRRKSISTLPKEGTRPLYSKDISF